MDGALPIVRAGAIGLAIKFRPVRLIRLLAAVLTARQKKFELPRRLAAGQAGLSSPEFRVMTAVLKYAAVANNRLSRWQTLSIPATCPVHSKPIHRSTNSKDLQIPTGNSHRR